MPIATQKSHCVQWGFFSGKNVVLQVLVNDILKERQKHILILEDLESTYVPRDVILRAQSLLSVRTSRSPCGVTFTFYLLHMPTSNEFKSGPFGVMPIFEVKLWQKRHIPSVWKWFVHVSCFEKSGKC